MTVAKVCTRTTTRKVAGSVVVLFFFPNGDAKADIFPL